MELFLPPQVLKAIGLLEEAGWAAYAVGGCVRDQALGIVPHDYDVCTAAFPGEMKRVFREERTLETGLKHGTLTVLMDGMPLEITTFRQDGEYRDGRHPDSVQFTRRVEDDLARRDFTINAMAYSPSRGLVDPFGGREDCAAGVIRCVGQAEKRFQEDSLRVLRALRFSARLGFTIEEKTAAALYTEKAGLRRISRERVAAELNGLLCAGDAGRVLLAFESIVREAMNAPAGGGWQLAVGRLERVPRDLLLRWAALLMDSGGENAARQAAEILKGLKMPSRLTENAELLIRWSAPEYASMPPAERLMRMGPEGAKQGVLLRKADALARAAGESPAAEQAAAEETEELERLIRENACFTLRHLAVRGPDLAALGYKGPDIGKQLNELLLRVVRGQLPNEKEALLDAARNINA